MVVSTAWAQYELDKHEAKQENASTHYQQDTAASHEYFDWRKLDAWHLQKTRQSLHTLAAF